MDIKNVTDNGLIIVSTVDTFDRGLETMVFQRDPVTEKINYLELDSDHYSSHDEAREGHQRIFNQWNVKSKREIANEVVRRWGPGELLVRDDAYMNLHELGKVDSREIDYSDVNFHYYDEYNDEYPS